MVDSGDTVSGGESAGVDGVPINDQSPRGLDGVESASGRESVKPGSPEFPKSV